MLRARCPDCGAGGREAELVFGEPDEGADPELHEIWREAQEFVAADVAAQGKRVGRNEPCPGKRSPAPTPALGAVPFRPPPRQAGQATVVTRSGYAAIGGCCP